MLDNVANSVRMLAGFICARLLFLNADIGLNHLGFALDTFRTGSMLHMWEFLILNTMHYIDSIGIHTCNLPHRESALLQIQPPLPVATLGACTYARIALCGYYVVSRMGSESKSLAFQASVLTITPPTIPDITMVPMPTI